MLGEWWGDNLILDGTPASELTPQQQQRRRPTERLSALAPLLRTPQPQAPNGSSLFRRATSVRREEERRVGAAPAGPPASADYHRAARLEAEELQEGKRARQWQARKKEEGGGSWLAGLSCKCSARAVDFVLPTVITNKRREL